MASTVSLTVSPELGEAVLDALLTVYQTQAEALHVATLTYLDERRSSTPMLQQRDALAETDALIELVGWGFGPRLSPIELVGPPALIREIIYATLVDAMERLTRAIDRYERGETDVDRLKAVERSAAALFSAFIGLEEGHR